MVLGSQLFEVGMRYRCKRSFSNGSSDFSAGEMLTFVGSTLASRSASQGGGSESFVMYAFESSIDGKAKFWLLEDGELASRSDEYFETGAADDEGWKRNLK